MGREHMFKYLLLLAIVSLFAGCLDSISPREECKLYISQAGTGFSVEVRADEAACEGLKEHAISLYDKLTYKLQTSDIILNGNPRYGSCDIDWCLYSILKPDLIILTTAFKGNTTIDELRGQLKVSANNDNFLQEAHVKLSPLDFASDGLYLSGCAKSPKGIKESIEEALGATMRASIPMKRGYIEAEGIVAKVDLSACNRCGLCWKRCPFSAIKTDEDGNPHIIEALCKGCGLCSADCPKQCINIVHFSEDQIIAQIEAALETAPGEKIIGFVCHWCALGGVDMAGVSRLQYPPHARLIRVMCSARVSLDMIEQAFKLGCAGVLVAGCEFPTCHYISGNYAAEKRLKRARTMLKRRGYDPDRLWHLWCSAADGPKFANRMREMANVLGLSHG